jgi:hypothetical protein
MLNSQETMARLECKMLKIHRIMRGETSDCLWHELNSRFVPWVDQGRCKSKLNTNER